MDHEPIDRVHSPSTATEASLTRWVGGATIVTVVLVFVLIVSSVATGKAISKPASNRPAVTIELTGNQWWWYVRYLDRDPTQVVVTANEIHIPVGRPVLIRGTSHDVIHSFWVPNLHGKRDLIPSRWGEEWIEAQKPGRYRGQCAEFCGLQHAHMGLWVVAEPEADYEKWKQAQLQPAIEPSDPHLARGQQVFLTNGCVMCHSITGTPAFGQVAPDLTHFGSRMTIAAGTLPNSKGNLGGWISDPQSVKPGNHMATIALPAGDLEPLIDYLESLK